MPQVKEIEKANKDIKFKLRNFIKISISIIIEQKDNEKIHAYCALILN